MRFHRLLHAAQSAEAILKMSVSDLQLAQVEADQVAQTWFGAFRKAEIWKATDAELEYEIQQKFRIVTEIDADYPERLRELSDRPPVLYVRGSWPVPEGVVIGLVGTRRASSYGLRAAEILTEGLVSQGVVTVSGLAVGIDTQVHRTTLNKEGITVAALGHGFGFLYPKENGRLAEEIVERKGALVTEFAYQSPAESHHFPRRNRIISGLSRGVVVVEAGNRSGALITARYAAEQGRDVFAVPANIFNGHNTGGHRLLKEGAKLVENPQDILDEYQMPDPRRQIESENKTAAVQNVSMRDLSVHKKKVYEKLSGGPFPSMSWPSNCRTHLTSWQAHCYLWNSKASLKIYQDNAMSPVTPKKKPGITKKAPDSAPKRRKSGHALVIVESPTKQRTIAKFLGQGYTIIATLGHIRDLPSRTLGVDETKNFEPQYVILPKAKKVMPALKDAIKKADKVYLATDFDREGEAIAWQVAEALKVPADRLWPELRSTKSRRKRLRNPWIIRGMWICAWCIRSRLDASWTAWSVINFRRCSGPKSAKGFPPAACSLSLYACSWNVIERSRRLNPKPIGPSKPNFKRGKAHLFQANLVEIDGKKIGSDHRSQTFCR